jgi:hypothetical protein
MRESCANVHWLIENIVQSSNIFKSSVTHQLHEFHWCNGIISGMHGMCDDDDEGEKIFPKGQFFPRGRIVQERRNGRWTKDCSVLFCPPSSEWRRAKVSLHLHWLKMICFNAFSADPKHLRRRTDICSMSQTEWNSHRHSLIFEARDFFRFQMENRSKWGKPFLHWMSIEREKHSLKNFDSQIVWNSVEQCPSICFHCKWRPLNDRLIVSSSFTFHVRLLRSTVDCSISCLNLLSFWTLISRSVNGMDWLLRGARELWEWLFMVMYRIGTKVSMWGESPMRRPLPEHALELVLDDNVSLRTRRNRMKFIGFLFRVRVHDHQVDFSTLDRTKRWGHDLLVSLFTDEACVCVVTSQVVRISFAPVDQSRARGEKL